MKVMSQFEPATTWLQAAVTFGVPAAVRPWPVELRHAAAASLVFRYCCRVDAAIAEAEASGSVTFWYLQAGLKQVRSQAVHAATPWRTATLLGCHNYDMPRMRTRRDARPMRTEKDDSEPQRRRLEAQKRKRKAKRGSSCGYAAAWLPKGR